MVWNFWKLLWAGLVPFSLALVACGPDRESADTSAKFDEKYGGRDESEWQLAGEVVDRQGTPLVGAVIQVADQRISAGATGSFRLNLNQRTNALLRVSKAGHRAEIIPVARLGRGPNSTLRAVLDPLDATVARMLFAGDTAFGRRYLDPSESTPRDALPTDQTLGIIRAADPLPGTKRVLRNMRPFFQLADFSAANLETPVTRNPATPHMTKDYAFFTLPGSLPALKWLGIDYVGLGNNHVFDYLDQGLQDTLSYLKRANIPNSGAGANNKTAMQPYNAQLSTTPYAFIAASTVRGSQHPILYVATDTKGGSANAFDGNTFSETVRRARAGRAVPIVQLHGGTEYTYWPSDFFRKKLHLAVDSGAALVVGHHPHVLQGIERYKDRYIFHSLGNFAFDQDRLETMLSAVAWVDMRGDEVHRIRLTPIYLNGFIPRPVSGRLADQMMRRVGEFSSDYGVLVYPYNSQGWVALSPADARTLDRAVTVNVSIGSNGRSVIDLRKYGLPRESLASISSAAPGIRGQLGRDVLLFGDFDRWEVASGYEGEDPESRWDFSTGHSIECRAAAWSGGAGLCSASGSVVGFRNRVRVMGDALNLPNKDLTFLGYFRGESAARAALQVRYYASEGDAQFGAERFNIASGGTFGWKTVIADLTMPKDRVAGNAPEQNPRALRIFLEHGERADRSGALLFDELAMINWDVPIPLAKLKNIATPHARDFLRVRGPKGTYTLRLVFRSYQPAFRGRG